MSMSLGLGCIPCRMRFFNRYYTVLNVVMENVVFTGCWVIALAEILQVGKVDLFSEQWFIPVGSQL